MTTELLTSLLRQMIRIRSVEEEIARRYPEGKMRCPTHLSIGQEAVPAAFSACVRNTDFAVSTHRGHAHYLAKGGALPAMIAEIYGKVTGCARGRGGSMHLIDTAVGFMGTSAIVGNSIPIGVGLALSAQLRGSDQIACIFHGDGAVEEGAFYESVNFAAVRKLPVVFICENNLYSVYSPLGVRQPTGRKIASMVAAMGPRTWTGDGNCAQTSFAILSEAMAYSRNGGGPSFVELDTYRWREHCGPGYDNDIGYRSEAEFAEWKALDPIPRLLNALQDHPSGPAALESEIRRAVDSEVAAAFAQAESAAFPDPIEAYASPYAE